MKKIDYEHFTRIKVPGSMLTKNGELFFRLSKADAKNDRYVNDLWRYKDGILRPFTSFGKMGEYILSEDGIIFTAIRDDADKKEAENTLPFTVLQKMPYDGGEAVEFLRLPLAASRFNFLSDGRFFFIEEFSEEEARALAKCEGDRKKAYEELKGEEDYHVVDEVPFYFNGEGFINKKRSRLCLYDKGEIKPITHELSDAMVLEISPDESKLIYASYSFSDVHYEENRLYELDINTLISKEITIRDNTFHGGALYTPKGELLVFAYIHKEHGLNENPYVYKRVGEKWEVLYGDGVLTFDNSVLSDLESHNIVNAPAMIRDGKFFFVENVVHAGQIMSLDLESGAVTQITHSEGDITEAIFYEDGFMAITAREGGSYELSRISLDGQNEERVSHFNDDVMAEYDFSKPTEISFINENGTEIFGWVLSPAGYVPGKKYPTILDIHGGPKCSYGTVYFHEMQLWASLGYAVIFCNPTGGDGRGDSFADIRGLYGEIDYRDIMKFTDLAIEKFSFIDKDNMGVTGGSYGGFMTNWIIGHTNRFKAAASQRSISNWLSFFGTSDIGYVFMNDQTDSDLWQSPEKAWNASPLKYANKCQTPTLFIHSDEDYRCPLEQGMQMFSALRIHGVPARMCIFKGENHELSRGGKPTHRIRRLKEITQWFDHYLKGEDK